MVKRKVPLSFLLFFMAGHSFLFASDLETFGYYENRFFILSNGTLSLQDISENFSLGDYNQPIEYSARGEISVTSRYQ